MNRERIAVVGAREHPDPDEVRFTIETFRRGTTVISGGAKGIDTAAREIALVNELEVIEYTIIDADTVTAGVLVKHWSGIERAPRTKTYSLVPFATAKDLLYFRNTWIAMSCHRAFAFTKGTKGGTIDVMKQFDRFNRSCMEIR